MSDIPNRFPVYSKILKLYPESYVSRYEKELLQTTADMLDDTSSHFARFIIWSRIAINLPFNLSKQQIQYVGGIMNKETPTYIKLISLLCALLLLPFFSALIANGLDKVINNHTLYGSWVWSFSVIRIWVLVLPVIAALLALITFGIYILGHKNKRNKKDGLLVRNLDIKHSWPILFIGIAAFGILFMLRFHDSFACWVQIPRHYLSHHNVGQVCNNYKLF